MQKSIAGSIAQSLRRGSNQTVHLLFGELAAGKDDVAQLSYFI